jgi:hypothetical protein
MPKEEGMAMSEKTGHVGGIKDGMDMRSVLVGVAIGMVLGAVIIYGLAMTGILRPIGIMGFSGVQGEFGPGMRMRNGTWGNGTYYPGQGNGPSGP